MFPKVLSFAVTGGTGATTTVYVPVPSRCTIKSVQAACSADPGDAETIAVAKASTAVGTLTFGTDISAGATGTYAKDSTGGYTVFDAGDVIKLTVSQLSAAATFIGYIEIDEFARTS